MIDRADGRDDGEDWTESYEKLPGGANIYDHFESPSKARVGLQLHRASVRGKLPDSARIVDVYGLRSE